MYSPSVQQQMIKAVFDDLQRVMHGLPAGHAGGVTRASGDSPERYRQFPLTLPRLVARFTH